jgi:hypothetical protein
MFNLGPADAKIFANNGYKTIPAGIPANDGLKNLERTNEYILIIVSNTTAILKEINSKLIRLRKKQSNGNILVALSLCCIIQM